MARRPLPNWTLKMRTWQLSACKNWWEERPANALWVATPGAGKTRAAARLTHLLMQQNEIDQVVIAVPKSHLRVQFSHAMLMGGIDVDEAHENGTYLSDDQRGVVVTYQQIGMNPRWFKQLTAMRTLVIMDEIHHAGDDGTWGEAIRYAFGNATYRLCLSGTPFRTKGDAIPFVHYDGTGRCVPDYEFDYLDALRAGVCRRLVFPTHGAYGKWIAPDGTEKEASFDDNLTKQDQSELLRTALLSDDWLSNIIAAADKRLTTVRETHPDAGALAVCMDQEHARRVADIIQRVTGNVATVIVSADSDASRNIAKFERSNEKWVVAVHMISEGVDIPRLRVAVYASNVATEMYFRQFCGRVVRTSAALQGEQNAYVYLPAAPRLLAFARNVHVEVQQVLKERKEANEDELALAAAQREDRGPSQFTPLGAQVHSTDIIAYDYPVPPVGESSSLFPATNVAVAEPSPEPPKSLNQQKVELRGKIGAAVKRISAIEKVEHMKIWGTLNKRVGGKQESCTLEQLQERLDMCNTWLKMGYDGIQ